ncbi:PspC domain protein [Streptococcus sanguinis SK49]|uniref:PspC domain protein n=1 Tax=Streptococcus sanguinis SK49 TaxID=888808 RepID=F3UYU1_STRSA|nr:PspC domain-containing protein [Streptococcus sanguinis]EGJ36833.1 PspC domain protein [Streptococcus sanguinis SK49]RSJ41766.1 DNA-binding transcriptional activator PspC [Streptococcus sanguinis]
MEKRLTRDVNNKKIAGVCAGIANYFNLDPTLVRVIWILFVCVGGAGVLAYLIAWAVIPEDSNSEA